MCGHDTTMMEIMERKNDSSSSPVMKLVIYLVCRSLGYSVSSLSLSPPPPPTPSLSHTHCLSLTVVIGFSVSSSQFPVDSVSSLLVIEFCVTIMARCSLIVPFGSLSSWLIVSLGHCAHSLGHWARSFSALVGFLPLGPRAFCHHCSVSSVGLCGFFLCQLCAVSALSRSLFAPGLFCE